MFPYRRLYDILIYLNNRSEPIPLEELVDYFHISEKTLRNDIQCINDILVHHGGRVERMRKKGYYIITLDSSRYHEFLDNNKEQSKSDDLDNAQKRITFMLQYLIFRDDYITQDELAEMMYVSRNTILNYIKSIKIMIEEYRLQLESKTNLGIRILGDEESKRCCFMELIISHDLQNITYGFTKEEEQIFEGINLYALEHIILEYSRFHEVEFSDFNLRNMVLHFALLISRIKADCPLTLDGTYEQEYDLDPLLASIEDYFQIEIPDGEIKYIYSHFMANAKTSYNYAQNEHYLTSIIDQLLHKIYSTYNFDLRNDHLLRDDLTHHFQSILNTKRYQMNKRNPLLNTIKSNYPLAYDVTLTSIHEVLKDESYQLTDDEVGYVSLHIGAAIERCFNAQIKKKSIILVCGSGYATSRMLEAKLNNIFRDKLNIVGRYSYHEYQQMKLNQIDFVISTVPIEQKTSPVVLVDFSLPNHDVEVIAKMIAVDQMSKNKIDSFFEEDLFVYQDKPCDKHVLLQNLCTLLEKKDYVPEGFKASVLKRESIAATNMDEILAIPHPMEALSMRTKVAVAILNEPMCWNEKSSVRIVFLLAISKNEQHNTEYLYDTFIQIMNHTQMQNQLLHATSFLHFMDILHTYNEQGWEEN